MLEIRRRKPKGWWDRFVEAEADHEELEWRTEQARKNEAPAQMHKRQEIACVKIQSLHRGRMGRRAAKKQQRAHLYTYTGMRAQRRFSTLYAEMEDMDDEADIQHERPIGSPPQHPGRKLSPGRRTMTSSLHRRRQSLGSRALPGNA